MKTNVFVVILFISLCSSSILYAINTPTLYRPSNNTALSNAASVTLQWYTVSGASGYLVELDTTSSFNSPVYMLSDTYTLTNNNTIANKGINNLFFGKTYYWRVRAVNGNISDTSDYSVVRTFTTTPYPALYSPSNGATLSNAASVTLQWYTVSGASGYLVELDTTSSFNSPVLLSDTYTPPNNNSIANKGINNLFFGKTYYWRVRAVCDDLNDTSAYSPVRTFTTAAYPALYSPSNGATLSNAASVTLQWYTVSGASGYLVELDTTSSFNSPVLLSDTYTPPNNNSIANKGINNLFFGKTYYWRVRAVCDALNDTSAYSPVRTFTTAAYPALYSPSNNTTLSNTASVTLQWYTVSGTSGYLVELDTTSSFNSPVLLSDTYTQTNNNTIANKGIDNLLSGTTYYWRVRTLSPIDTSAWSYVWRFTTAYQLTTAPTLVSPANGSTEIAPSGVELVWNEIDNVTGYRYQVATDNAFASIVRNGTTAGTNATCNLMYGTTYYWRVQGYNASGNSVWSAVWNFSTQDCQQPTGETSATACSSYLWHGTTYTESGNYTITIPQSNGCDSVLTLHLTINQPLAELVEATACDSYEWNGETYTESGTYEKTFTASNGCDSVVTLHLTINHPLAEFVEAEACDSYEWNGETYTESGTYYKTFTASNGCDSVVTLQLTINESPARDFSAVACGSYVWNNQTYTESGNYTITVPQSNGCDSIITLHLTINHPLAEHIEATACDSYEWNGETYTESGTYDKTFTASNGCDSVVTLHLTINHPQTGLVEVTACDSYEWDGDTYTESGTYDKTFTASNGCDSVVTLHLTINHPLAEHIEATACDSYEWNGETYTESGTYEKTFTASNGCDSVVTLQLTINESVQYSFTETATSPYTWNGIEYTETGDYTQNFTSASGCDSIVTLHLNILSGISQNGTAEISIYPNPATSTVSISCGDFYRATIIDMLGRIVMEVYDSTFDISGLRPGEYIVKVTRIAGEVEDLKLVKE